MNSPMGLELCVPICFVVGFKKINKKNPHLKNTLKRFLRIRIV